MKVLSEREGEIRDRIETKENRKNKQKKLQISSSFFFK